MKKQKTKIRVSRVEIVSVIFLLVIWLLTSGCCLLLASAIVTALCPAGVRGG
jgi:hypothetical protein